MKKYSAVLLVAFLLAVQFAAFSETLAQSGEKLGPPDHVWQGPWPDPNEGGCPQVVIPVRDRQGNVYPSPCDAALHHVRNTWDI
jgi:hypothetical protein